MFPTDYVRGHGIACASSGKQTCLANFAYYLMSAPIEDEEAILSAAAGEDEATAGADDADADEVPAQGYSGSTSDRNVSQELKKLKAKWQEMEEEAKTLRELGEKQEADDKAAGEPRPTANTEPVS